MIGNDDAVHSMFDAEVRVLPRPNSFDNEFHPRTFTQASQQIGLRCAFPQPRRAFFIILRTARESGNAVNICQTFRDFPPMEPESLTLDTS